MSPDGFEAEVRRLFDEMLDMARPLRGVSFVMVGADGTNTVGHRALSTIELAGALELAKHDLLESNLS